MIDRVRAVGELDGVVRGSISIAASSRSQR